jgi:uncharacterized protein (TIGR03663 family)
VVLAVGAVALLALVLRLVALGARPAHWDEARVAYWALRFEETGAFAYDHIVHGPLLQHVDRWLFALLGPSDFVARLPTVAAGTLLPASALLFRDRLRESEVVALAVLLAVDSALLYYSRFMRSDLLVATAMVVALGCLLRAYDRRQRRYLYGAAVALALGFASKENAILYVATWLGAFALVADTALFRPDGAENGLQRVKAAGGRLRAGLSRPAVRYYLPHVVGAVLVCLGALLFLFAPRGEYLTYRPVTADRLDATPFWTAVWNPLQFPGMVLETATYTVEEYTAWTNTAGGDGGIFQKYDSYGRSWVELLGYHAAPLVVLGIVGFVHERYAAAESRSLVMFFAYAGVAAAVGYPLAMDIFGAWNAVHVAVPLSVPAAVGVGTLLRWANDARADRDLLTVVLVALVVLAAAVPAAAAAYGSVYGAPDSADNRLVQYGQPTMELRETLTEVDRIVANNPGTDVLVYGSQFTGESESAYYEPACLGDSGWFDSLPLPWYYESMDAEVACAPSQGALESQQEPLPPVIVTHADNVAVFDDRLEEYDVAVHQIRTTNTPVAVFTRSGA